MARRGFDPAARGWKKTEYREGDILDRDTVDALVKGADVVVHLAFIINTGSDEGQTINLQGSRNVFEAAAAAGAKRLVYTSSVAAYGFAGQRRRAARRGHRDRRAPSATPTRARRPRSSACSPSRSTARRPQAYVFRPCIVAGPRGAAARQLDPVHRPRAERMPGAVRALFDQVPVLKPVLPDSGVPFQLVHHDDVADALVAATVGTRRARRLQPRRRGRDHDGRPGARDRLVLGADPGARRRTRPRRSSRGCRSCRTRRRGSRRCASRC